jgi:outer membrane protein
MKRILVTVLILSVSTHTLFAQTNEKATLTFKEAVKIGLENNVVLNQQKNQLNYTQTNKTASLLQLGPSVDASLNAYRNDGNSFNQQEGRVVNGKIDYVNGSIDASIPIFNGLNILNQYKQASNQNEAQLHLVAQSAQDVIRNIANQYLNCLLDQELIKIDEENVAGQQLQYDQIKAQVDVGSKAEADLFNQEYQLKNAELLLVRSRIRLRNDLATLALTLQIDPAVYFEVAQVDWDINQIAADSLSVPDLYAVAKERRSDLKRADFAEKAARFGYASLKGRYFPSIYAGASYGSRYNYIYGESNRSFDEQFRNDNTQFGYGLSMSIPIFYGMRYRAQAALSKVTYENAKLLEKDTEVKVKSEVISAYQNFNDAKANYDASAAQLRAAELTYKTEKERYDLGISNMVQLTTTNQAYVKAKGDFQSAKFTLMFQKLLINYATGTLKIEDIP